MEKIVPVGSRVLVKRMSADSTSKGGIVIPDVAKKKPLEGKVVALGDGRLLENGERIPFQVKVGDRIIFSPFVGEREGVPQKTLGDDLLLIEEEDIFAVVETGEGKQCS